MPPTLPSDVLQYARYYGVAADPKLELGDKINCPYWASADASRGEDGDIHSLTGIPPIVEKLAISREAARLLHEVAQTECQPLGLHELNDECRVSRHKLEQPLLRTDHEQDILTSRSYRQPSELQPIRAQPLDIDIERDEGLDWPQTYFSLQKHFEESTRHEKLQVSKDSVLFLKSSIHDEDSDWPFFDVNDEMDPRKHVCLYTADA